MADEQQQGAGTEWALELNVAGVQPASGKSIGGPSITKSGVYTVQIKGTRRFTSAQGNDVVAFDSVVIGGEFDGQDVTVIMPGSKDATKDPEGKRFAARWKTLLANTAKDASVLEKGAVKVGPKNLEGRKAFIYAKAYPPGTPDPKNSQYEKRPDINFMAPAEATKELEAEAALAARRAGGTPAAAASSGAGTPAAGAAPVKPAAADPLADI